MNKITHDEIVALLREAAQVQEHEAKATQHSQVTTATYSKECAREAAIYREAIRRLEAYQACGIERCKVAVNMLEHEQGAWVKKRAARRRGMAK